MRMMVGSGSKCSSCKLGAIARGQEGYSATFQFPFQSLASPFLNTRVCLRTRTEAIGLFKAKMYMFTAKRASFLLFPSCSFSISSSSVCRFDSHVAVSSSYVGIPSITSNATAARTFATAAAMKNEKRENKDKVKSMISVKEKRRTRSDKEFDEDVVVSQSSYHVPVMLGEVLDVFSSSRPIHSFIDCTVGAAGHSSAIIQAHPGLKIYVGMDVDPVAHQKARARINALLPSHSSNPTSDLRAFTLLKNFKHIKSVLNEIDKKLLISGFDGILMDLGMSSMQVNNSERGFSVLGDGPLDMRMDPQASLKAEDILNSWPETEVGRILREYGEESNWRVLQNKIVQARLHGGLHSTGELVDLIQNVTRGVRGGRQGWIKTATRVFQALRIAVNDELMTLENSLYACFDCLAPGGRLAVISFHSLEDRIVKQTFLNIIGCDKGDRDGDLKEPERYLRNVGNESESYEKEAWIRQVIHGRKGTILTKRPITPSEREERLNRRSRSAKLRVIQKF